VNVNGIGEGLELLYSPLEMKSRSEMGYVGISSLLTHLDDRPLDDELADTILQHIAALLTLQILAERS